MNRNPAFHVLSGFATILLVLALLGLTYLAGTAALASATAAGRAGSWRMETCRYARFDGSPHWTEHEIRLAIACAARHFPVPGGVSYALCICEHESSFYPHATAGAYKGLFQLSDGEWNYSWQQRADLWRDWNLRRDIFNPRSNAVVSISRAHDLGWGGWTTRRFC